MIDYREENLFKTDRNKNFEMLYYSMVCYYVSFATIVYF